MNTGAERPMNTGAERPMNTGAERPMTTVRITRAAAAGALPGGRGQEGSC
jgi:hypothetical protein